MLYNIDKMKNKTNIKNAGGKGMTKTEIKDKAHFELMAAMQVSFHAVTDRISGSYIEDDTERELIIAEMDKQMKRVEKMFGYIPGSWTRGI